MTSKMKFTPQLETESFYTAERHIFKLANGM